ncbi:hypothetical protein [Burkholderia sp. LMG 13014]|uniref:hypothetical protein n=1 Tax=Burkholderia sp. LMG 13014 TaxID=2709306 RepID=UPI001965799D|nr:hypothetical protein [Burkholderia sp. LMG 13014]
MEYAEHFPIGYASRANFASSNLDDSRFDRGSLEAVQCGCLDAIERMPAGSVECDPHYGVPFATVSYR